MTLDSENECLSPDLVDKAERELMEKPSWRERDIQALREMVLADVQLVSRTEDAFLLRFLRARKFDYDRAFKLLRHYYSLRVKYPHLYHELLPSNSSHVLSSGIQGFLNHRDDEGRAIFIYRGGIWNTTQFSCDEILRANLLCLEQIIQEPDVQINGVVAILDMRGLGLQHVRHFTPSHAKQTIQIVQDSFPARFKAVHIVNEPAVFDVVFAITKPFLSEKLKSRICFHGSNLKSLHEHIGPHLLPSDYGGNLPPFDNAEWTKKLLDAEDVFRSNLKYGPVTSRQMTERNNEIQRTDPMDGFLHSYKRVCIQRSDYAL